ncbi:hypothetical protein EDD16DRAFT_1485680, partial [Pisolithus croceorrhizus]
FPTTHGLSGHCLFIFTFMLASGKVIYDDMYSIKSWCTVMQQIFQLWEIVSDGEGDLLVFRAAVNHGTMEGVMWWYLGWGVTMDALEGEMCWYLWSGG